MGRCSHTFRSASRSEYVHSSTDLVHMPYGRSPDFHYSGFKRCVDFSTIKRPCTQRGTSADPMNLVRRRPDKKLLNSTVNANVDVPDYRA